MRPDCGLILRDAAKTPLLRMRCDSSGRGSLNSWGRVSLILRCADGSFYIGITRTPLEISVAQHNAGAFGGYTDTRRPVTLVFSQWFDRITDAIENERKLKKWSRAKKEAFIRGDFATLRQLSARKSPHPPRPI
jgi:putative endonuclease